MTDQCKAPEGVARDVSKSGLKDQDKQVAKDLLSDIQVFKLPSSGTGERTPCLPAKQTLDEYQFRGGGEADQFAKILGLPESAAHRPRDITNLVMESTPEYTDHTLKAEVALKAGNPNLKDNEIIGI